MFGSENRSRVILPSAGDGDHAEVGGGPEVVERGRDAIDRVQCERLQLGLDGRRRVRGSTE